MKTAQLLFLGWMLIAFRAFAADTNLSQTVTVERPLNEVIRAMQTYYYDTNYHGHASAVHSTNAVPGVSYSLGLWDCAFGAIDGMLDGEMVATRISASSTKLDLVVKTKRPKDTKAAEAFERCVTRTLERVAKIAEGKP